MRKKLKVVVLILLIGMTSIVFLEEIIYAEEDVMGQVSVAEGSIEEEKETPSEELPPETEDESEKQEEQEEISDDTEEKTQGEEEESEVKDPISPYEFQDTKPNGNKGYYTKKISVEITHKSKRGITKYELYANEKKVESGKLEEENEHRIIKPESFQEGKNIIKIWMEDEEGNKIEEYATTKTYMIDTKDPELQISLPEGGEHWYRSTVPIKVECNDKISGADKIQYFVEGDLLDEQSGDTAHFVMKKKSTNGKGIKVKLIGIDRAGNKAEETRTIFLDSDVPVIWLNGVESYGIVSKNVALNCEITDENLLKNCTIVASLETPTGKEILMNEKVEILSNPIKKIIKYKKSGIYHITVTAEDYAGHLCEKKMQFIIDKETPEIRNLSALDGKYIKYFCMDYGKREIVKDFTSYRYEILLDGNIYRLGQRVDTQGWHCLEIKATDAAGNKAEKSIRFFVDHTKPEIVFEGVEEGEVCDEAKELVIFTKENDILESVIINGVSQILPAQCRRFTSQIEKEDIYNVVVKAKDLANNQTEKRIGFTVEKRKYIPHLESDKTKKESTFFVPQKKERVEVVPEKKAKKSKVALRCFEIVLFTIAGSMIFLVLKRFRHKKFS